jgi:hypothetical protein
MEGDEFLAVYSKAVVESVERTRTAEAVGDVVADTAATSSSDDDVGYDSRSSAGSSHGRSAALGWIFLCILLKHL